MKKQSIIIASLLALCMVFVFAGCGGSGGSGDSGDSTPPEEVKGSDCFFDCPATGYGFDLPEGVEITTGAQREHRYEVLKKQAAEKGLDEDVKFYLEFFKYGCPPHGGFGIGVDRLTMLLLGLHIKEAMFIFRGPNRLNP